MNEVETCARVTSTTRRVKNARSWVKIRGGPKSICPAVPL